MAIKSQHKRSDFENRKAFAKKLDESDPLKKFRKKFIIPSVKGKEQIYFLGNSLGLQSNSIKDEIEKILGKWGKYGVEGFFMGKEPWMDYHDQLTQLLSKIIGAKTNEIAVMNQLTVNLHLMMVSFYQPKGKKNKIICEAKAFPSDQYMFETHLAYRGLNPDETIIEVKPHDGEHLIRTEDILSTIEQYKDELALVLFSGVNYYTGQVFDIKTITDTAHSAGAIAGFDLAHAAGNIPLRLHDWDVDFACWCSYKYLNSGPGGVGGVFIHEKFHHGEDLKRFGGWWGYDKETRFQMNKGFRPIASAEGWQLSTPSLLMYASHKAALEIFEEAGWEKLQAKRKLLNDYLWFLLNEIDTPHSIQFITPRNEEERGCQVSMLISKNGKKVFDELGKRGIMADWREPNVIRIAPVALYNTFEELWRFAKILKDILNK